ncbi:hypothetical protein [Floridanema evergladense]|uniref:Uncharacterized protein n=1 Tax=Floridaenema evergladense BLCC-F167 TaxID=3153639 RepID=A0ABV4WFD7_9CYAN
MKSTEIIQLFAKNYSVWLKQSQGDRLYYQKTLTANQTKWFLDTYNRERNLSVYQTDVSGEIEINSKPCYYHLIRFRDGMSIFRVEPLENQDFAPIAE